MQQPAAVISGFGLDVLVGEFDRGLDFMSDSLRLAF